MCAIYTVAHVGIPFSENAHKSQMHICSSLYCKVVPPRCICADAHSARTSQYTELYQKSTWAGLYQRLCRWQTRPKAGKGSMAAVEVVPTVPQKKNGIKPAFKSASIAASRASGCSCHSSSSAVTTPACLRAKSPGDSPSPHPFQTLDPFSRTTESYASFDAPLAPLLV